MSDILGYGAYIPKNRIKIRKIAKVWGKNPELIEQKLGLEEKAVPDQDEDTITIATQAARNAVKHADINPQKIGAIYTGSESHPYAVKPTSATVGEAIGATPEMTAADYEFACKAGTAGMQNCMALVESGKIDCGMAIGADTAQSKPGGALEYAAAAGGAAYIIGEKDGIAEIEDTYSFTTDTPDFWRRKEQPYPEHGGRFTGKPAYFRHVINATKGLLKKTNQELENFDHIVFHQPNTKFPTKAAKKLGIPKEKIEKGLIVRKVGNTYSGATLLGLASVLDDAEPGEKILVTSFGSGAGSDSFSIKVKKHANNPRPVKKFVERKKYVNYGEYTKLARKLRR